MNNRSYVHFGSAKKPLSPKFPSWAIGEFFGTFLLVFFGCGSVAQAITFGAFSGIFQIAIVWGLGITTAIYLTGSLSGAHLNPAVTVAMAAFGRLPRKKVAGYIACQFLGAFAAACVLYALFSDAIAFMEQTNGIVRGKPGSEASAMIFAEFFPNPGGKALAAASPVIGHFGAFLVEMTGTAILLLVIFCVTDPRNESRPQALTALSIGLTVTCLICLLAPLTMAGFNPARDLAPRLFTILAGWKLAAFTANGLGWLTVYVAAPVAGGLLGGFCYRLFFERQYQSLRPSGQATSEEASFKKAEAKAA